MPTNARVVIALDEPVQAVGVDQVILSAGGNEVAVVRSLSDGNRTLTLTPLAPLNPLTLHTVQINGLRDLAGNTLATMVTTSFTTGSGVDLISPTVTQVDLAEGTTGVPTNVVAQVMVSERVNPFTVTPSNFFIRLDGVMNVVGEVAVAADGLSAMFTPDTPLLPSANYRVTVLRFGLGLTDLAGNQSDSGAVSNFSTAP